MSAIVKKRSLPLLPTGKPVNASMSKTDLLLLCQWWASPRTPVPKELGETKYHLRFGTAFHKCMELFLRGLLVNITKIANAHDVERDRLEHFFQRGKTAISELLKQRKWSDYTKLLEKKLAYDPFRNTMRFLESTKERDYSGLLATEFPGTGDLALIPKSQDKPFVVIDYKTGSSDYDAAFNGQLKSLGLGLSVHTKNPNAIAIIFRIDDDFIEPYEAPLGPAHWEEHQKQLRNAIRLALSKHPPIRPGEHCANLYCNAIEICPAHAGPFALGDSMHGMIERDQLGPLYARFQAARKLIERLGDRFKEEIARNGPFETEEGFAELVPKSKENLSKASIRRAMGLVDGNSVIEQLEERGCIETSEWEEIRVKKDGR